MRLNRPRCMYIVRKPKDASIRINFEPNNISLMKIGLRVETLRYLQNKIIAISAIIKKNLEFNVL